MEKGYTESSVGSQSGKTIVITGANTGLGYEAARVLSSKGARVYIACRSKEKAVDAIARIESANGSVDVQHVSLDLNDLSSVRRCADELQSEAKIDTLINNAGIMIPPYALTKDGFESQFGVNHLGHFALTGLLLNKLEESENGRVVTTSSIAHRGGKLLFDDINATNSYNANERYSMSKLANLLFTYELQRRLESSGSRTISVACHPGIADTELSRYFPGWFKIVAPVLRPFFNTPASGAWPTLRAAADPGVRGGDYFGPVKRKETAGPATLVQSNKASHNRELAVKLWNLSIEMTEVDPGI